MSCEAGSHNRHDYFRLLYKCKTLIAMSVYVGLWPGNAIKNNKLSSMLETKFIKKNVRDKDESLFFTPASCCDYTIIIISA